MLATWPCSEKLIEHVPFGTSLGRCLVSFWAFGDDFGHRFWCLGQSSRRAARAGLFLGLSGRLLVSFVALFPKTDGKTPFGTSLGRFLVSFWTFGDGFGHRFWCLGPASWRAARSDLFLGLSGRLLGSFGGVLGRFSEFFCCS